MVCFCACLQRFCWSAISFGEPENVGITASGLPVGAACAGRGAFCARKSRVSRLLGAAVTLGTNGSGLAFGAPPKAGPLADGYSSVIGDPPPTLNRVIASSKDGALPVKACPEATCG